MNRRLRVAVIGCGDISSLHLAAIAAAPEAELVAVCDPDIGRRIQASEAHRVPGFADHLNLFALARPDVVHVCTPHSTHAAIAVDALERGIHVVLEKPLAHDRAAGDRIVAAAEARSAKIAVCFQNRYNEPVQAASRILRSGDLGKVLGSAATVLWHRTPEYYLDRPWRGRWATAGGGLLMNQAIHTLDLVQWLVGDVTAVTGTAHTRVLGETIEVEDTAEIVLTHANGARSVFYATLGNAVNAPVTLDITAERGTLSLRGDLTVTRADGATEVIRERAAGSGERAYWGVSHELLIHDFYRALDSTEPFWIGPAEAMKTLDVIQDIYDQSYPERAGRTLSRERTHS